MQHNEIIGLIKGATPFSDKTFDRLSNVLKKYPYFQAARLLYTLNLLHLQDSRFLFELRKTAVYMPDRKQLCFHIENDFFNPELIDALRQEALLSESASELIDTFLSESGKKTETETEKNEIKPMPAATDYVSCLLSDDAEDSEAPPLQYQDTIDKFLEMDAVSPFKITLDKPNEAGEELLDPFPEPPEEDAFFSETLAEIYIKQEKYDKALEVLRKLNLEYPEKSRSFADQIQLLENLINNTSNT